MDGEEYLQRLTHDDIGIGNQTPATSSRGPRMTPIVAVSADRSPEAAAKGPNAEGRFVRSGPVHVSEAVVSSLRTYGVEPIVLPPHPTMWTASSPG